MKLIDLLVQELPKRGGWPEGASNAYQVSDSEIRFGDANTRLKRDVCFYPQHRLLSLDFGVSGVTREQYEAALAASQKVEWNGVGLPPVGCECEYNTGVHEMKRVGGDIYKTLNAPIIRNVRIVFVHGEQIAAVYTHNSKLITIDGSKYLRPLRSEAERAIDEMVMISGISVLAAKILYATGYRKG